MFLSFICLEQVQSSIGKCKKICKKVYKCKVEKVSSTDVIKAYKAEAMFGWRMLSTDMLPSQAKQTGNIFITQVAIKSITQVAIKSIT